MFSKIIVGVTAIAATFAFLPTEADAGGRHRGHGYYKDHRGGHYYAPRRVYYAPRQVYYAPAHVYYAPRRVYYDQGYYNQGYYPQSRYRRGYDSYYDGRSYGYDDRRYYRRRCGSGTSGAIIGGAGGALLGREIGRGGRRGYYSRRGGGTGGAIIGGAVGALIGREVGRSC